MPQMLLYAALLGLLLSFMVGPVFFTLIETAINRGFKQAFAFDLGVVAADALLIVLCLYGSELFLDDLHSNPWAYLISGLGIVAYGIREFRKGLKINYQSKITKSRHLLLKGFLLNFINVGVLAYWLTIVVVVSQEYSRRDTVIYFGASLLTYLLIDLFKIFLARKLKSKLTPPRLLALQRGVAIFLIGFGIFLIGRGITQL